jgi:large subunit ribosomal protein L15
MIKTHKRKKSSRMHGRKMGTHGTGARKNNRESGNRGGKGMSGSGKRADQKKTLITKLYGHGYFGKKGITSIGTKRDKRERINLSAIVNNLESLGKKTSKGWEINLPKAKILNSKDKTEIKEKLIIHAKEASKGAIENVKKAGGDIILPEKQKNKKTEDKEEVKKSESSETKDKE